MVILKTVKQTEKRNPMKDINKVSNKYDDQLGV